MLRRARAAVEIAKMRPAMMPRSRFASRIPPRILARCPIRTQPCRHRHRCANPGAREGAYVFRYAAAVGVDQRDWHRRRNVRGQHFDQITCTRYDSRPCRGAWMMPSPARHAAAYESVLLTVKRESIGSSRCSAPSW